MVVSMRRRTVMNRILLTGTAFLALINVAVPASAAHKHATGSYPAPVQPRWVGSGARVDAVDPNSPAERAGMRPGDLIVGVDGRPVDSSTNVLPFVAQSSGRPMTVDIKRGGTIVRLRARPQNGRLGFTYTIYPFGRGDDTYVEPPPIPPDPPIPPFIPNPN
jgi:membrane-associated protease RseP (regulator of RpoE activity)